MFRRSLDSGKVHETEIHMYKTDDKEMYKKINKVPTLKALMGFSKFFLLL